MTQAACSAEPLLTWRLLTWRLLSWRLLTWRLLTWRLLLAGESGGRADVRWVSLSGAEGAGLAVAAVGGRTLQMNVSRYSVESFDWARHDHELEVSHWLSNV